MRDLKQWNTNSEVTVSVVVAVFNEEKSVGILLDQIEKSVTQVANSYEIVVVDDGSTDETLAICRSKIAQVPGLRIVELYKNVGQVAALSAGMSIARGDWLIMMDGDLQHDPNDIYRLAVEAAKGYDLVATFRQKREDTVVRRLITFIGNTVNRYLTNLDIRDFGSAYRMFSREILKSLKSRDGYVYYNTPALYANARRISQIPITQYKRVHGSSKWTLLSFILYNLDFVTVSFRLTQILLGVSLTGIMVGVVLYILHLFGITKDVQAISAPVSIVFTGFIVAIIGILWRELIQLQRLSQGIPPFLIRTIYSKESTNVDKSFSEEIARELLVRD